MRRGPAPKSRQWRILSGNAAKRPMNRREPQPKLAKDIHPPVKLDEHAQKFWRIYSVKLKELRLLSELDLHLLAMAAQWWSVHVRALAEMKEITQTTEANGKVAKPEIANCKTGIQCGAFHNAGIWNWTRISLEGRGFTGRGGRRSGRPVFQQQTQCAEVLRMMSEPIELDDPNVFDRVGLTMTSLRHCRKSCSRIAKIRFARNGFNHSPSRRPFAAANFA
jgi:phage terminase small subunit